MTVEEENASLRDLVKNLMSEIDYLKKDNEEKSKLLKSAFLKPKMNNNGFSPAENEEDIFETNSKNAIKGLLEKNIIYKLGNRYSICERYSQTSICKYLYEEFFKSPNQKKFGGYITPADFKGFSVYVFNKMNYAVNENSIKREVTNFINGTKK